MNAKLSGVLCLLILAASCRLAAAQDAAPAPAYAGSRVCTECHEAEAEAWRGSHHQLAWTYANEATVLGDFAAVTFSHHGIDTRFSAEKGTYFVETEAADGSQRKYKVVGVAGIEPLQQYLIDTGNGHVQALDVAWDVANKRWYHLYPDQDLPAGDGLYWTGPYKNWNARCAECHATGFEKNYSPSTRRYQSSVAEIGVGCEACHGPAASHVAWARGSGEPYQGAGGLTEKGFTIGFSADAPETEIQQCAGCHARREPFGDGNPLPGTPFHDAYRLALLGPGLYHPDGHIRDEVYVYGSFLQSKMYQRGVRCTECHEPHAAELKAEGNAVCTQCHSPGGNDRFPTLRRALYDDPVHHFHDPGTPGAQCKSCHMIERVYMGIDGRRDHSFRVPRPDLTAEIGTPNACNDCHGDRDPSWAAEELRKRFPNSDRRGAHFGQVLFRAWNGDSVEADLLALVEHDGMPDIVRASALELLQGSADPELIDRSARFLSDQSALVRAAALGAQRAAPPAERIQRIIPLLSDRARSVRMAAAREMLNLPLIRLPEAAGTAYRNAIGEWRASLMTKADFPETHLALGGAALVLRNLPAAEAAFREAVRMDPQRADAWSMIVRILDARGDRKGALETLDTALSRVPGDENLLRLRNELR